MPLSRALTSVEARDSASRSALLCTEFETGNEEKGGCVDATTEDQSVDMCRRSNSRGLVCVVGELY